MKGRTKTGIAVTLMAGAIAAGLYFAPPGFVDTPRTLAEEMLEACAGDDHRPTCYEKEVPELLDRVPVEKVFDVIRELRKQDVSYQFCHVLAHELGAREVAKDPARWLDVITKNPPDGLCSNGFIHGAALERFNKDSFTLDELEENVIPDLSVACEARNGWSPTELDRAICYHGVGHLLVYLTEAKVSPALELCERIANHGTGDFRRVCYEGVFMQLFQPLEPEDYALIDLLPVALTKDNLDSFCSQYEPFASAACWREGWPLFRDELKTAEGMEAFCARETVPLYKDACFETTIAILGRFSLNDQDHSAAVCNAIEPGRQAACFSRVALSFAEEDRANGENAVRFCERADTDSAVDACYDFLGRISTFVYHPDDPNRKKFCEAMPGEWSRRCTDHGSR